MSVSRRCSCYHEAGHAVAWVVNGDELLLVIGCGDVTLTPDQQAIWEANRRLQWGRSAGETMRKGRSCAYCKQCGRTELSESCRACVKVIVNHLTCIFAGGAATALLLQSEHAKGQMANDLDQIQDLVEKFAPGNAALQKLLCELAQRQANNLVRREAKTVYEVADELFVHGVLDGPVAERIIRRSLQAQSF